MSRSRRLRKADFEDILEQLEEEPHETAVAVPHRNDKPFEIRLDRHPLAETFVFYGGQDYLMVFHKKAVKGPRMHYDGEHVDRDMMNEMHEQQE